MTMSAPVVTQITEPATTIGEGPHWDESSKSLLYVDIWAGDIHKYNTETKKDTKIHLDDSVGFVVPRRSGGYITGLGRKFAHVTDDGAVEYIGDEQEVGTQNRFNDGKCDASGRIWAGTMGHESKPAVVEKELGHLFTLEKDRSIRTHLDKISVSNGLAWTADNSIMYYIDSIPRKVFAFDFDKSQGTISNKRVAVDFEQGSVDETGFPDGMTIDTNGKLWVAGYWSGKVMQFDPETGKKLKAVEFPAKRITSCCFGGPNYEDLYVTSARYKATEEELTATPLAGATFKVTGLGAKGTAPYMFEG